GLHYLEEEVFWPLAVLVAGLVASNIFFYQCVRRQWLRGCLKEIQICSDLVFLTAMLHFSGGIENPAIFVYVFHVIISGILLDKRKCYATVVLASVLFGTMAFAEMSGKVEHYTLLVFPHAEEEHGLAHAAHEPLYVASVVAFQIVLMSLVAYFTTTIMRRLRAHESRALAERQRLERVLEATRAGFVILDKGLSPVWLNDQAERWLKWSGMSAGRRLSEFQQWIGAEGGPAAKTFNDGKIRVVERQREDADGNKQFFQVTVAPMTDKAGQVYQVVELTQDITQRKLIEAEMMHSAKMTALGGMAAGIAHEVGNPLASISVRLKLLEEEHDEAFLNESLELLRNQTDRIARIVRGVSQFSRPAKDEWTGFQVNDMVEETLKILRFHKLAKHNQVLSELADDLPETTGVKDQLAQVFLNLGLNALEAMPGGGTLTVKTFRRKSDICIEFADTGEGISSEISGKIFDPFFSTKETGQGLGLSIVHNIVYAHGGRIEVEDNPGGGSVFRVALPIRASAQRAGEEGRTVQQ
ncbi:MAG: ATP-binding protein, partial [Planctomycetia bacterium]|nr:ATP-binding protein [Planctomycetia bacterium]